MLLHVPLKSLMNTDSYFKGYAVFGVVFYRTRILPMINTQYVIWIAFVQSQLYYSNRDRAVEIIFTLYLLIMKELRTLLKYHR